MTYGLLCSWAFTAQAQDIVCPDPPPTSSRTDERYVEVNASIVSKLLSAVGLGAGRKVTVDDVISRYPNPGQLFLVASQFALQCQAIMASPELDTMEKKRAELRREYRTLFDDLANLRPMPSPPESAPTPVVPSPAPYGGISAANAARTAEEVIIRLHRFETTSEIMSNVSLPFCLHTAVIHTAGELSAALNEVNGKLAWADMELSDQSGTEFIGTVGSFLTNPIPLPADWADLPDKIRNCQSQQAISPEDYIYAVALASRGRPRFLYVVVVSQQSGLVKSLMPGFARNP